MKQYFHIDLSAMLASMKPSFDLAVTGHQISYMDIQAMVTTYNLMAASDLDALDNRIYSMEIT